MNELKANDKDVNDLANCFDKSLNIINELKVVRVTK